MIPIFRLYCSTNVLYKIQDLRQAALNPVNVHPQDLNREKHLVSFFWIKRPSCAPYIAKREILKIFKEIPFQAASEKKIRLNSGTNIYDYSKLDYSLVKLNIYTQNKNNSKFLQPGNESYITILTIEWYVNYLRKRM